MAATLATVAALQLGVVFAFAPAGYNPDDPEARELPRLVCTGLIPISSQQVRRRTRGIGDQYSVYYHAEGTTDGPTAKRVPWNQSMVFYGVSNPA